VVRSGCAVEAEEEDGGRTEGAQLAQGEGEAVDVIDTPLKKVVDMIRGPKGTVVNLTVIPADAADPSVRKVIGLVRDEIKLEDQEAKAKIIDLPSDQEKKVRLGLIDLPSFYASFDRKDTEPKSTTVDVTRLLRKLKREKVDGIILDLRRNGGGSLEEAINLTGLFIKEGPVVQVKDHSGKVSVDSDTDSSVLYDGPLIVLTSRFSASASEIVRWPIERTLPSLCEQFQIATCSVQQRPQRTPLIRLATIASPLPEPPSTMPRSYSLRATASATGRTKSG